MSVLPKINVDITEIITKQQAIQETVPKEYAWDYDNNDFLLKDGKFQRVEGKEAIKVWIWKALNTEKGIYKAYSLGYGNDLEDLIDSGYSKSLLESEAKRLVWECISVNSHITSMENFKVDNSKDLLAINFTVITDQGEVNVSV
jgi:hypothetical protein